MHSVARVREVMERVDMARLYSGNPDDNKYIILHITQNGGLVRCIAYFLLTVQELVLLHQWSLKLLVSATVIVRYMYFASIHCRKCQAHKKCLNGMLAMQVSKANQVATSTTAALQLLKRFTISII